MSEAEKDQMFDPFFSTRKDGTGLGLAVSHQIVEQHNGSFAVTSNPGQGTRITVILPRQQGKTLHQDQ
jgi:two-component system sensor histidine kinase HydH